MLNIWKFDIGELVFVNHPSNANKAILEITEREWKKCFDFRDKILPSKYYTGIAFPVVKDEVSGLYVLSGSPGVLRPDNPESWLNHINPEKVKVDLERLAHIPISGESNYQITSRP